MQQKKSLYNVSIFEQIKDFFYRAYSLGTVKYSIENIKFVGKFFLDKKKLYTLKSCDIIAINSGTPTKEARYKGIIRQIGVEGVNMITFNESEEFNQHLEDIRQIRHPNIGGGPIVFYNEYFATLNIYPDQRILFIYKEYDDVTLSEILHSDKNFFKKNSSAALKLLTNIGDGLLYLHRRNMVHGEIHSDNIILSKDGVYKLINSCFFHILSHLRPQNKLREMKNLYYHSPESIFTEKVITKEEDVWAFGIIIYNLFHGFENYYFKKLNPIYQIEPDACLIHMFHNYGPFPNEDYKMPEVLYNICAGGIWKPIVERANIKILMKLLNNTEYKHETGNFVCNERGLYDEIVSRISDPHDSIIFLYRYLAWRYFVAQTSTKKDSGQKSNTDYAVTYEKVAEPTKDNKQNKNKNQTRKPKSKKK